MASQHAVNVGRQVVSPSHAKHSSPLMSQIRTTSNGGDDGGGKAANPADHPSDCSVDQALGSFATS